MKRMLVVVDYQKDFVDGTLGFAGAEKLDAGIAELIRKALAAGDTVVCTYDTHDGNYLSTREGKHLPVYHCICGKDGWRLYGETGTVVNTTDIGRIITIDKKDCFGVDPKQMLEVLPEKEPEVITFVGLVTNMCVIANACVFQARYPNAQIQVVSDLCGSFDPTMHEAALQVMQSMQMQLVTAANL